MARKHLSRSFLFLNPPCFHKGFWAHHCYHDSKAFMETWQVQKQKILGDVCAPSSSDERMYFYATKFTSSGLRLKLCTMPTWGTIAFILMKPAVEKIRVRLGFITLMERACVKNHQRIICMMYAYVFIYDI